MIKILKLVTGEEILGEVEAIRHAGESVKLSVKSPCILQFVPSRNNPEQIGMALVPYAAHTKDHTIVVDEASIVWQQEPVDELRNQYNSIFGNGIVIAKSLVN